MGDDNHLTDIIGDEDENGLAPHSIIDLRMFGRRLRALRIMQGLDRAADVDAADKFDHLLAGTAVEANKAT